MNVIDRAKEVLDIEIGELRGARDALGGEFRRAVELMLDRLGRGGKIVVAGVGKSFYVGQKISAMLASVGSTSVAMHPSQAQHGDLGILAANDVLLAISFSGESEELLSIIPAVRRIGAAIVAMSRSTDCSLAAHSDVAIPVKVAREACPFNMAPTSSATATMAVGDALAIVLLEARGFKQEEYAMLHPGGAIGRTLLKNVADIMRKSDRAAFVPESASVYDAILAMTGARAGCVGVVDGQGKAVGVFTDGDLRRLITSGEKDISGIPIIGAMTRSPVTVRSDALAVDVLKIFETHNIDDILVVDAGGRMIGIVDIQDLPRFKIM